MASLCQEVSLAANMLTRLPIKEFRQENWVKLPVKRGFTRKPASDIRGDNLNNFMLDGVPTVRPYGIPLLQPCCDVPLQIISFSEAVSSRKPDKETWVHFFEDDYKFQQLWNKPRKYLPIIQRYGGAIMSDFSTHENLQLYQQITNAGRNFQIGAWLQHEGVKVIGSSRWNGPGTEDWSTAGLPLESSIFLSIHGMNHDDWSRSRVRCEIQYLLEEKHPKNLLIYGNVKHLHLDRELVGEANVFMYEPDTWRRSGVRL